MRTVGSRFGGLWIVAALLCSATAIDAQRTSFRSQSDWEAWTIPSGAAEVSRLGVVRPVEVRKNINSLSNAELFGGGFRGAGSNPGAGSLVFDGDMATGWAPSPERGDEDGWLEIDLGRLVTAERITLEFSAEAPPFEFFRVLLSSGEPGFTNALVPVAGSVVFSFTQSFGFNDLHQITLDFPRGSVRVIRVEVGDVARLAEGSSLVEIALESIGDNIALGLIERGGSISIESDLKDLPQGGQTMVDGDIKTIWSLQTHHAANVGKDLFHALIFDLGAHYWVDQIRIVGEPMNTVVARRNRYGNFFWYQILGSNGSLAPDGTLRWTEIAFQPRLPDNTNVTRNFDHEFPVQKIRYLKHFFPSTEGGQSRDAEDTGGEFNEFGVVSEYQIYGEGFPAEITLTSPILDLGSLKSVSTLEWASESDPGAQVVLRSRTGNKLIEETHYYDQKGKEQTKRKWEKTPSSLRGPIVILTEAGDDWSLWSRSYTASGESFRSPSPRRYVQIEARLLSDSPDAAASLSQLSLDVVNPIALTAPGEIYPREARPGVLEDFRYFIRPQFDRNSRGFDRVRLTATVPVTFMDVQVGNESVDVEVELEGNSFVILLPSLIREEQTISFDFNSIVFQSHTRFDVTLENSVLGREAGQSVEPGNASDEVESETIVVSLPVGGSVLSNLVIEPGVVTPNGDNIGDELAIEIDVLRLVVPRPFEIRIFDLGGSLVRDLRQDTGTAQHYSFSWDGRDHTGELTPPGLYLLRLEVLGDARTETVTRVVGVAY